GGGARETRRLTGLGGAGPGGAGAAPSRAARGRRAQDLGRPDVRGDRRAGPRARGDRRLEVSICAGKTDGATQRPAGGPMTPEEVEELLRRVPELQPPPGLEDRLPRAAAPKRFPAATAIAASIMFCLGILYLVIDSAQDPAPPSLGIKDEALRIVIEHQGDCDEARCTDLRHWKQKPADLAGWRTDRRVVILAKSSAPWGAVRRALDGCVQAGLVRIDYSSPGGDRPLPVTPPPAPRGPEKVILEQIRIILSRKPGREETVRKVGNRAESPTIEDLMHIVLTMVADYGKAGKAEAPIHIDPGADVPWEDVLQIVEICRKERLGPVEFVP